MKFLITQAYSTYNKGEAAIAIGIIKTIRMLFPGSEVTILSPLPEEDSRHYSKYGVRNYERLLNIAAKRHRGGKNILVFLELVSKSLLYLMYAKSGGRLPMDARTKSILNLFQNADVVIIGGGGMFGGNKLRSISGNLFPIYLAKQFRKKVIVYAPSVEPFSSKIVKMATRFAFNKADIITVREQHTFDLLKSLGINKPFYMTADPAFLIDHEPLVLGQQFLRAAGMEIDERRRLRIGMTIRNFDFPGEADPDAKSKQYLRTITSSIERILLETDAEIVLFTTAINTAFKDDDRIVSKQIKELIREDLRHRILVLTDNYTPEEIKAMIGNMDLFVATRTHSAIFALTMNIPVLNVACEPYKNHGIMEMMGLQDFILDAATISTDTLVTSIYKLIKERDLVNEKIREQLPTIKNKSLENGKYLLQLLGVDELSIIR